MQKPTLTDARIEKRPKRVVRVDHVHPAFESKWGFHPVDREDFAILKALHKLYWETWRQAYARMRWGRKMPHNRVRYNKLRNDAGQVTGYVMMGNIAQPFCDDRVIDWTKSTTFTTDNGAKGLAHRTHTHYLPFQSILQTRRREWSDRLSRYVDVGVNIVADFKLARTPQEKPADCTPIDMDSYRALYTQLFDLP